MRGFRRTSTSAQGPPTASDPSHYFGNIAIRDPQVTDDQGVVLAFVGGESDGDGQPDPGETWIYSAAGTAVAGQYANVGTVSALDVLENPVTASDSSSYVGAERPAPPPPDRPDPRPPVTAPDLPPTGWASQGYVVAALVLLVAGTALVLTARKARRGGRD